MAAVSEIVCSIEYWQLLVDMLLRLVFISRASGGVIRLDLQLILAVALALLFLLILFTCLFSLPGDFLVT